MSGVVYEPSGRLPLYNVAVFVPNSTPKPFVEGVSCETCGASITGSPISITLTDAQGKFTLSNVPVGSNIPLVIQIGRWRRQVTIPTVTACTNTTLSDSNVTRLPRNKSEGDIPKMALVSGDADPFECLLLKMIDASEFTENGGDGGVHFFRNNGLGMRLLEPIWEGPKLYGKVDTLKKYDVVFLPCEGGANSKGGYTKNIVDYTAAGGRMFTTHYGYVWTADGSPPFPSTAHWMPESATPEDVAVTINQTFPKGQAFASWLENVGAASGGIIQLVETRKDVGTVTPPTIDWMHGDSTKNTPGTNYDWTPHLTFNVPFDPPPAPDGGPGQTCGRVVFSDFHVASGARNNKFAFPKACNDTPFTPQEKALVFMMFDLASCVQDDSSAPQVCRAISESCTTNTDCCSGLSCQTSTGAECNGQQGCTCQSTIG